MPNEIKAVPEFTQDEGTPAVEEVAEEVKQDEVVPQPEPPADEQPEVAEEVPQMEILAKQKAGLESEREKLLAEIKELRGQRREIKREELIQVNKQLEDLDDVNPDDIRLIDKVLRARGYLTKEEQGKMQYDAIKQEQLNAFLEQFPEYKPENDPNDINWNALQRELGYYRMPQDPYKVKEVLMRAHRSSSAPVQRDTTAAKQHAVKTASVGSGGTQRQASRMNRLDETHRQELLRGGWTEEEIAKIESRL